MFTGLIAYVATPMNADGEVRSETLGRHLDRLAASGIAAVGLLGSTGSYMFLGAAERRRAVSAAAEAIGGRARLVVGAGALRTDEAAAAARDAARAGADGLLLAAVSYTPLRALEVEAHVTDVAQATDLPLCLYDNPAATRFAYTPELAGRLSALPTVTGIKLIAEDRDRIGAQLASYRRALPEAFAIGFAGDANSPAGLAMGADAWHSILAGFAPDYAQALWSAARSGDEDVLARLHGRGAPLWDLLREWGGLRVAHAAMELETREDWPPQRPLQPMSPDAQDALSAALERLRD